MVLRGRGIRRRALAAGASLLASLACALVTSCGADDNVSVPAPSGAAGTPDATTPTDASAAGETGPGEAAPPPVDAGHPIVQLSDTSIDFAMAPCGATNLTQTLTLTNQGTAPLAVAAKTTGSAFAVVPTALTVPAGMTGTLSVTANIPGSATAGATIMGSLGLFTNDPTHSNLALPLSASPTGATLALQAGSASGFSFPTTAVGTPSAPVTLYLVNTGNAPATFSFGPPSDPAFALSGLADGGTSQTLNGGDTLSLNATFTPKMNGMAAATTAIGTTDATCGASVASLSFSGEGATGSVTGWPTTIDFGAAQCGGTAPTQQMFTLSNSGAIVAFDTSGTPNFGSFGAITLLKSAAQDFKITNTGSAPADITLTVLSGSSDDAGSPEAGSPGGVSPFFLTTPTFTLGSQGQQDESVIFTPNTALPVTGSIAIAATGAVCGALPAPIPVSGSGLGGGPTVVPTSLTLQPTCGGPAPVAQTFLVRNDGTADFTWSLSLGAGVDWASSTAPATPDAGRDAGTDASAEAAAPTPALYRISASPPPGLLIPGASSLVTVSGTAIPTGGANPDPSAYAGQVTVTTDVPLDPPHVVSLTQSPLGDQLALSMPSPLRFGQVPVTTTLAQTLVITNTASAGSPAANVSFALSGAGAAGYAVAPKAIANLAAGVGASSRETVTFSPTAATSYPATLTIVTNDALCTPLPTPLQVSGTGTNGQVALSASTLAFGTDANDPAGLVNCGATGLGHSLTVSNVGNQAVSITGLTLGKGASSPYVLSGPGATVPAAIPIGGSVSVTITPNAIPQTVADPNDATAFADTLSIATDATGDTAHVVNLVMQPRGAVIADSPLTTTWTFGTISFGSIATFTSSIRNTGNAGVTIGLSGLAQPTVFGLQNSRTKAPGGKPPAGTVTSIVGTFTPLSSNGSWTDQGTLVVSADQAFCQPLPMQWGSPTISLSGASNSNAAITLDGSLAFPSTNCGDPPPDAQTVTLTNLTNVSYGYTLAFGAGGKYYSSTPAVDAGSPDGGSPDGGTGTLPANGSAIIVVTPKNVTAGAGVSAGAAAYADELLITVMTTPPIQFTRPISWALNGAVLSLPNNADGTGGYLADSTGSFLLPMSNSGTVSVSVSFSSIDPAGAFSISPAPPISLLPGVPESPQLTSDPSDVACAGDDAGAPFTSVKATFSVSGPVCQPFPQPFVTVKACAGTL